MALDIYSTRAQLAAIEQMPREYSFIYDTFCSDAGVVEDDKAIYDFRKGVREMAPIVHENVGGVVMGRTGYETREIGFCTIAPERIIDLADLSKRSFGEQILGAMTPQERERKMLIKDLAEMRAAIQRRREWMALQVLLTGKLDVFAYTNEGKSATATKTANYGFTNNFTATTKWDQAGAKIVDDMNAIFDIVYEGLGSVDTIVMAPDVASALLANDAFMKTMDMKNVDMGEINTKYRGQGVRFIGRNSDGVKLFSYAGKYIDDAGAAQPCIPGGKLIAGSADVIKCIHGPITQVEREDGEAVHKTYVKKEVPLRYGSIENNTVKNRLTSRPTMVPFNVDAWAVGTVL